MNSCKDIFPRITLWLDGELHSDEELLIESHLIECESCRGYAASERRFLENVRNSRTVHVASAELRARVSAIVETPQAKVETPQRLRRVVIKLLSGISPRPYLLDVRAFALIAAIVGTSLTIGIWYASSRTANLNETSPSSFALMAADTHRRYLQKQLPLEIVSDAPNQISTWFHGKVPFGVELPDYKDETGQPKLYKLEGGRLVGYKQDYAAYVAYRMEERPISLVMTSTTVAQPEGGEQIAAQGLTFHFNSIYGYKVITWSDRGLTYALVSDLEERGQQSCGVCHQDAADQDLIQRLKPKPPGLKLSVSSALPVPNF